MSPSLAALWGQPAFRQALLTLLASDATLLDKLRDVTAQGFEPPAEEFAKLGSASLSGPTLAKVTGTLYLLARDPMLGEPAPSPEKVVEDLESLAGETELPGFSPDDPSWRAAFLRLLEPRPSVDRSVEIDRVVREAMPTLDEAAAFLDFRLGQKGVFGGPGSLIPVFLLRLTFDEPIQGSGAVTFQLTEESLRGLRSQLDAVERQLSDIPPESRGFLK